MNIGLVGFDGFIGSHMMKILSNHNIYKVDINLSEDNSTLDLCNYDAIVCLAGIAHKENNSNFGTLPKYLNVNFIGVCNLIRACKNSNVNRFIYLSSVNVSNFESSLKLKRVDNNSVSKWLVEGYISSELLNSQTEFVIIRAPMVYGKNAKANFAALFSLVAKKIPLPLGLINKNSRSLISVYNLVNFIETCFCHPNAANQTFQVSDDNDLSTVQIVKLIGKVQGIKPLLLPIPVVVLKFFGKLTGKSDMVSALTDSFQFDISYTKERLHWTPPYSVEEGFFKCVEV